MGLLSITIYIYKWLQLRRTTETSKINKFNASNRGATQAWNLVVESIPNNSSVERISPATYYRYKDTQLQYATTADPQM